MLYIKNSLASLILNHGVVDYQTPINFNYLYGLGALTFGAIVVFFWFKPGKPSSPDIIPKNSSKSILESTQENISTVFEEPNENLAFLKEIDSHELMCKNQEGKLLNKMLNSVDGDLDFFIWVLEHSKHSPLFANQLIHKLNLYNNEFIELTTSCSRLKTEFFYDEQIIGRLDFIQSQVNNIDLILKTF